MPGSQTSKNQVVSKPNEGLGICARCFVSKPCRKRAVPFAATCAKVRLFNTSHFCFRAGLIQGKLLKNMVSAEGIEPSTY